jgi:hypothetical protein
MYLVEIVVTVKLIVVLSINWLSAPLTPTITVTPDLFWIRHSLNGLWVSNQIVLLNQKKNQKIQTSTEKPYLTRDSNPEPLGSFSYKVHSPSKNFDYRPISILPVLTKVFENVRYEQMVNYVGRNSLISSFQSGFRPGHHSTAIAMVYDDIRLNMESNQPTILVLLDFSKSFDSVFHVVHS